MNRSKRWSVGAVAALATLSLAGSAGPGSVSATTPPTPPPTPPATEAGDAGVSAPSGPLCDAIAGGGGGAADMADDPVADAVNGSPLLSRLAAMVTATGLEQTLAQDSLTVFAPINSAFDKIDPATLDGLLADPEALTGILTHHVIPEQLTGADLVAGGTFVTAHGHGAELTVSLVGETLVINGGEAAVLCADVPTANATVYLIDTVLTLPPDDEPADTTEPIVETTEPVVETTDVVVEATDAVVETTEAVGESTVPGPGEGDADGGPIEFPEGATSTTVEGTTTNQSFDSWSVAGEADQLLELSVASEEGNVTFDVFTPAGDVLADDQTSFSAALPADGLYAIEVGTGADSADYTLTVAVTG